MHVEQLAVAELGRQTKLLTIHISSTGTLQRSCIKDYCTEEIENYPSRIVQVLRAVEVRFRCEFMLDRHLAIIYHITYYRLILMFRLRA